MLRWDAVKPLTDTEPCIRFQSWINRKHCHLKAIHKAFANMAKSGQIIALHLAIDTFLTWHLPVGQIASMEESMTIHFYCKGATHIC